MEENRAPLNDMDLRANILTGLAASADLEKRFRASLERFLAARCDRSDGRSQNRAVEIVNQVMADCFVKSPSLLERWKGPDNLEAFLRTVATNRLKSWWASPGGQATDEVDDSVSADAEPGIDKEEAELAELALRAGAEEAMRKCPEGLVFLRLKGLHGVDQRAISRCWDHHEAQTSRRIKEAMDLIRATALATAAQHGCELTWSDLVQGLQRDPSILLGSGSVDAVQGDFPLLKSLAEGGSDAKQRRAAVETMCRDPQSLGFFAQALNRQNATEALVVKDPALSGMSARLTECIRCSFEILQPAEATELITPLMFDSFADTLKHLGADGGTLWLLCPGAAALEAVFNPLEPEMAGKRQPLVSGIVSLVLATGEPACISQAVGHERHSPVIDMALGKTTRSMIAVPVVLAGTVRGVLTAVRLKRDDAFGERETRIVARHAEILADLLIGNLTAKILG